MGDKVVMFDGYFKRAGRRGHPMKLAVHHMLKIRDGRGVMVDQAFAVRMDEAGRGQIGTFRVDGFLGPIGKVEIDETPMSLDRWYLVPDFGANFSWVEKIETPEDLDYALERGAKPLADFVVKPEPVVAVQAPTPIP